MHGLIGGGFFVDMCLVLVLASLSLVIIWFLERALEEHYLGKLSDCDDDDRRRLIRQHAAIAAAVIVCASFSAPFFWFDHVGGFAALRTNLTQPLLLPVFVMVWFALFDVIRHDTEDYERLGRFVSHIFSDKDE